MQLQETVRAAFQAQQAAGKTGFYFLRAEIPEGKRGKAAFWNELTATANPLCQTTYKADDSIHPYYPLLNLIRDRYQELTADAQRAVLASVKVHHRHRHIFHDWLETGIADREDDLFRAPAEIEWERGLLFQSLTDLTNRLWTAENAPILVLENFELAGLSIVNLLLWMIEQGSFSPLRFICVFNRDSNMVSHWSAEFRQRFFSQIEAHDIIQHYPADIPMESDPNILPEHKTDLLTDIALSRCFMAYEEINAFSNLSALSPHQAIRAGYTVGLIHIMTSDIKKALIFLAKALETARQAGDEAMIARINAATALSHSRSSNFPAIEKHMLIARKTAQENGDRNLSLTMEYMRFMVHESYTANPANWTEMNLMIDQLKAAGLTDQLLDLKSNISYYESCIANTGWENAYREAVESLALAESIDNLFQASKLHHVVAFLCQMENRGDEAIRHFDQCIAIRRKIGTIDELVRAYNGVGYLCFTLGRFKTSLTYFEKSLELLEPQKTYTETCLTLFNIVNIYFFTGCFAGAQDVMERILIVLNNLNLESLPFHSHRKLFSFAGCAAYLCNQKTLALDYWNAALKTADDKQTGAIFPLLCSFTARTMNDTAAAEQNLAAALEKATEDKQLYFIIFLLLIRACFLRDQGSVTPAEADFNEARDRIEAGGLSEQRDLLEYLRAGGNWKDYQPILNLDGRIRMVSMGLADSARQEAANLSLIKKLSDISFLKDFQDTITRDLEEKELFQESLHLLKRNFSFSGIHFIENRLAPKLTEGSPAKRQVPSSWFWTRLFGTEGKAETVMTTDPSGSLMAYPFRYNPERGLWAVLTTSASKNGMSPEELEIVRVALTHMDLTLDLHRAKEALKAAASRDNLTGAYSRQEFINRVEGERQRLTRYATESNNSFAIVFMDLDNFKQYNDNFGHPAGDYILQSFARLAQTCLRNLDSLGRFGGDEFIMLLPATGRAGAKRVAARILDAVSMAKGFQDELARELGYQVSIPEESLLNCSIGISIYESGKPASVDELIEQADKALYQAKNAGKGVFRFFGEAQG